ncbi:hypothetical protein WN943_004209 [Citrus x changshan-huyou]
MSATAALTRLQFFCFRRLLKLNLGVPMPVWGISKCKSVPMSPSKIRQNGSEFIFYFIGRVITCIVIVQRFLHPQAELKLAHLGVDTLSNLRRTPYASNGYQRASVPTSKVSKQRVGK